MENISGDMLCSCCKASYLVTDRFCGSCGFPFQGSPEEQKQFRINYSFNEIDKNLVNKRIGEARIILFVISGFTLIQSLLMFANDSGIPLLITNLIICGIYAGLGFWAKPKPFAAILTGGLIYVSLILLSAFFDPSTIYKGILFKIIFITAFVRASYGAYKFKVSKII
jgi:hypothetical protein